MKNFINPSSGSIFHTLVADVREVKEMLERMSDPNTPRWVSRKQLAEELDCSERTLRDRPEFMEIEHRIGNKIFYAREDVDRVIRSN